MSPSGKYFDIINGHYDIANNSWVRARVKVFDNNQGSSEICHLWLPKGIYLINNSSFKL